MVSRGLARSIMTFGGSHPNPKAYPDNLIEILTAIDEGNCARAASLVGLFDSRARQALTNARVPRGTIGFAALDHAVQSLNQHAPAAARKALIDFDTRFCAALHPDSLLSEVMSRGMSVGR